MHEGVFFFFGREKRRGKCGCPGACLLIVGRAHNLQEERKEGKSILVVW